MSPLRAALLKPLYEQALREWPLLGTPVAVAARFENASASKREMAGNVTDFYTSLCGGAGFVFGVPGLVAAPVTLPLNVTSVALLQLHMCAALATLGGFDAHSGAVRELSIRCLLGEGKGTLEQDEAAGALGRVAVKVAERGVRTLAEQGAKVATHGALKRLPFVGGVLGSVSDIRSTRRVAEAAQKAFLEVAQVPELSEDESF